MALTKISQSVTQSDVGLLSFRNKLINGNFDFWQRGASFSEHHTYDADRWYFQGGGTTVARSRQEFSLGQTDVPGNPDYFHRSVVNSVAGSGNYARLNQRIESVKTLMGKKATVSFHARVDAPKSMSVELLQYFGSGGGSADNTLDSQTVDLTTNFQKFKLIYDIQSGEDKTVGTSGDDFLGLYFWFDAGSDHDVRSNSLGQQSGTFDIAQVQVEEGEVATPFENRPIGIEELLCKRYFWRGVLPGAGAYRHATPGNTIAIIGSVSFPTLMRVDPTPDIVVEPTYVNCVHGSISVSTYGFVHRGEITGTPWYRAYAGIYTMDAEL
jgi:hypothetical protein